MRLLLMFQKGLGGVTETMNAIATLWIFGLLVLINSDVLGRFLFNAPVRGTTELVILSIVGIVFLQLPSTLRHGRLTIADSLFAILKDRRPRVASAVSCVYDLAGAALFAVLFWASYPYFRAAWRDGLYVGTEGDFTVPTWPIRLIILLGCAGMTLHFLLLAFFKAGDTLRTVDAGRGR